MRRLKIKLLLGKLVSRCKRSDRETAWDSYHYSPVPWFSSRWQLQWIAARSRGEGVRALELGLKPCRELDLGTLANYPKPRHSLSVGYPRNGLLTTEPWCKSTSNMLFFLILIYLNISTLKYLFYILYSLMFRTPSQSLTFWISQSFQFTFPLVSVYLEPLCSPATRFVSGCNNIWLPTWPMYQQHLGCCLL